MQKLHPVLRLLPETVVTPYYAAQDRHRVALIDAERYVHKPPTLEAFIDEVGDAAFERVDCLIDQLRHRSASGVSQLGESVPGAMAHSNRGAHRS